MKKGLLKKEKCLTQRNHLMKLIINPVKSIDYHKSKHFVEINILKINLLYRHLSLFQQHHFVCLHI
jgi:hypothetical protein